MVDELDQMIMKYYYASSGSQNPVLLLSKLTTYTLTILVTINQ